MGEGEEENNLLKHFLFHGKPAFSTSPGEGSLTGTTHGYNLSGLPPVAITFNLGFGGQPSRADASVIVTPVSAGALTSKKRPRPTHPFKGELRKGGHEGPPLRGINSGQRVGGRPWPPRLSNVGGKPHNLLQ